METSATDRRIRRGGGRMQGDEKEEQHSRQGDEKADAQEPAVTGPFRQETTHDPFEDIVHQSMGPGRFDLEMLNIQSHGEVLNQALFQAEGDVPSLAVCVIIGEPVAEP